MDQAYLRSAIDGSLEFEISEADARREWRAAKARGRAYWAGDLTSGLVLWEKAGDGSRIAAVRIWRPAAGQALPAWHAGFFGQFDTTRRLAAETSAA